MAAEWEQQPGETPAAWRAFCVYRDLGPGRSIDAAWKKHTGQQASLKRAARRWFTWSVAYGWEARTREYDAHIERETRQRAEVETIKRRAEMLRKHQQAGELLRARGVEYFAAQKVDDGRTAIAAVKTGIDVERQAEGLPTWVVELLNADESDLRRQATELDARRRAALALDPETAGDALSVRAGRNGHGSPELQPASADPETGRVPGADGP